MKFDLIDYSEKLLTAEEDLASALTAVLPLEREFTTRKNLLLEQNMGLGTQALRDAVTEEALKQEEIYDKYKEAVLRVRLANNRRDTIKEICSNIRSYEYSSARSLNPA